MKKKKRGPRLVIELNDIEDIRTVTYFKWQCVKMGKTMREVLLKMIKGKFK